MEKRINPLHDIVRRLSSIGQGTGAEPSSVSRLLARTGDTLRALGEASPDLLFAKDEHGRFIYANAATLAMLGRKAEDTIGLTVREVVGNAGEAEALVEIDGRILATGRPETIEETVTDRRTGAPHVWQTTKTPLRNETGQVIGLVGISRDVTDARRAEEALAASRARLQELVDTLDLATVMVRDFEGRIRFWATGCEQLYGWTAAEALGRSSRDLLSVEYPIPLPEIEAILLERGFWTGELRHRDRKGRSLVVSARKVLRRDASGEPVIMESLTDLTDLKRTEDELRRLNEELNARVAREVEAREAAIIRLAHAQRMEALGQLAGGIAHDFNNVLQAVEGAASLIIEDGDNSPKTRRLARIVGDAARRGSAVTGRLLVFSRAGDLRPEPLDAASLLSGMAEILSHTLGAGVRVTVETDAGLPPVLADRAQLETALVNLATNARDAMNAKGRLRLAARTDPDRPRFVEISVADEGAGMSEEILARALEPFFTTKPIGQGTGLGLPMARGFAEQSGGGPCVESRPGAGTTVTLWLPAAGPGTAAPGRPAAEDRPPHPGPRGRILMVDDEPFIREVTAQCLEGAGFAVLPAASGAEALALLDSGEPVDLLLTDLSMPGLDGLALIAEARRRRHTLPAILLTGHAARAAEFAADLDPGPYDLLTKPVPRGVLAERIAGILEAARLARAPDQASPGSRP